jgi:hypothetical protein
MSEKGLVNQSLTEPQLGDSRLSGMDRLNENKLSLLFKNYPTGERISLLQSSLEEITYFQDQARQSRENCDLQDPKFVAFQMQETFFMLLRDYVQKRQKYIHKLVS